MHESRRSRGGVRAARARRPAGRIRVARDEKRPRLRPPPRHAGSHQARARREPTTRCELGFCARCGASPATRCTTAPDRPRRTAAGLRRRSRRMPLLESLERASSSSGTGCGGGDHVVGAQEPLTRLSARLGSARPPAQGRAGKARLDAAVRVRQGLSPRIRAPLLRRPRRRARSAAAATTASARTTTSSDGGAPRAAQARHREEGRKRGAPSPPTGERRRRCAGA